MDLSLLFTADSHEEGCKVDILDINLNTTSISVWVKGSDSATFKRVEDEAAKAYAMDKDSAPSVAERLAKLTIKWENMPNPETGEPMEFSEANAALIYEKGPFIAEQVNRAIANRANFIKASPSES